MKTTENNLEIKISEYVDQVKDLLSPQIWQNVLMECSKNELFVLWLLYRGGEANMTQIADYINVPLNTATGIISRMEKKNLVCRQRSESDKRIVTICMGECGQQQIQEIMKEFLYYGKKVAAEFSDTELALLFKMFDKITKIMSEERDKEQEKTKIRKILIE